MKKLENDIMKLPMIVAVDFDGTLCRDEFPAIGVPRERVINRVKHHKEQGHKLILWTCRNGERLQEAIAWCAEQGLEFDAINENLPEIQKAYGQDTRKVFADFYMDDKSVPV